MNKLINVVLITICSVFLASPLFAREHPRHKGVAKLSKISQDRHVETASNIANWEYFVRHDGRSAHTPSGADGGIYPRGTTHTIFQDGFIWGGIVRDTRNPSLPRMRVGGQTYAVGTSPGWIQTPGTATTPPVAVDANDPRVAMYRIRTDWQSLSIGDPSLVVDAASINEVSVGDVTDAMQQAVLAQYEHDWNNWPWELGAPFYDINGNGQLDPGVEQDLNGDGQITVGEREEPGIGGADQVIWYVVNDLDEGATTNLYGSPPIGLEVQHTIWAYNQPNGTLGQLIFKSYLFINKSGFRIDSMFVAQWSDPDVGVYTDDLVGSDVERSLGFAYSGFLTDANYDAFGLPPAAVGYDFFQGPLVKSVGDTANFRLGKRADFRNLPMISFGYFAAGSPIDDPDLAVYDGTLQWYNLLNGFTPTADTTAPTPFIAGSGPNAGQPTKFPVSGDVNAGTGDLDGVGMNLPPGDRRMSLSSGPFRMEPGDTQEVVVAVIGGIIAQEGGNNKNAVAAVQLNDDFAQFIFDNAFEGIPRPPASPKVSVALEENQITLEWGSDRAAVAAVEKRDPDLGFHFEGYNVYQLPNRNATASQAKKIATFDLNNNITQISATKFLPEFGAVVSVPIQNGKNTGIQRFITIKEDFIRGGPIFAGNRYYYAVTAYNAKDSNNDGVLDVDVPEPSLESSLNIIEVIPQGPKPGTRQEGKAGQLLTVDHTAGKSDGQVQALVVNPAATTGQSYEVFFTATEDGDILWNVRNTSTGAAVFEQPRAQVGDLSQATDEPIFDGLQVRVSGPPPGVKSGDMFSDPDDPSKWGWDIPQGTRRFTWAGADGFGWEGFRGAIGWGSPAGPNGFATGGFPEPRQPADLKNVLLMLAKVDFTDNYNPPLDESDPNVSYAYRYGRGFANPPAKPEFAPFIVNPSGGYSYQGYQKSVPLSAWDIEDPDNPRRLSLAHLENNAEGGLVDGKWWPGDFNLFDNVSGSGPREWLFIIDEDYSETPNPAWENDLLATPVPIMYWLTVNRRGPVPFSPGGTGEDQFAIFPGKVNTVNDVFAFQAPAVVSSDDLAREDLDAITVFPNPYYGFNPEESNRFDRFVTFAKMPKNATVRIFALDGTQVRKLVKDTDNQFLKWDLRNEANLPVASGIYICHIDAGSLGEKIVKVFVVQRAEILDFF